MTDARDAAAICGRLVDILSESAVVQDSYFAGLARALQLASEDGLEKAVPIYQSLDLWGGAGSLSDSAGCELPVETRRKIQELIVDLRNAFHHAGIDYALADEWAGTFRSWLSGGDLNKDLA